MKRIELHPSACLTWAIGNLEACLSGRREIEPVHFLLAILRILDDVYHKEAQEIGLSEDEISDVTKMAVRGRRLIGIPDGELTQLRRSVGKTLRPTATVRPNGTLHRSPESRQLFKAGAALAVEEHAPSLTLLHLLSALLVIPPPEVADLLPPNLARLSAVRTGAEGERDAAARNETPLGSSTPGAKPRAAADKKLQRTKSYLASLGRDLTDLARRGRLKPVVGRAAETRRIARYLQRTTKRNVLIVGEAGVGKTAVVEGLAIRLSSSEAPEFLRSLHIVEISVAQLLAGTRFRGDMEERVQNILEEATADPDLVLFLDEVHLLVGAGAGGESSLDLANLFKPVLARDEFRCIGATTTDEFERYIKRDSAFLRRFQILHLQEPSEAEALEICREWVRRIEAIQGVAFEEDALQAAVHLSARLIRTRRLPDKAIDLLENAAALAKVSSLSRKSSAPTKVLPRIGHDQIVSALEEQYGISASSAAALNTERLESVLRAELVGQDEAIAGILGTLNTATGRANDAARPLGVFIFTGPTGVGKTFAAECISRALFDQTPASLGRFNMSEYKERHELARLIGAPPGFIGHERRGALFRYVSASPQGLILLDEMEKAHAEIQDYFLQILDKGETTDSRGATADFRRHLVIMTCNVSAASSRRVDIGFRTAAERVGGEPSPFARGELARHFRQEFLARVDRIIEFRSLDSRDYGILLDRLIERTNRDLASESKPTLQLDEVTAAHLCKLGVDQGEGARGFLRLLDQKLLAPLRTQIAMSPSDKLIRANWSADGLRFTSILDS